jgi:DNA processing protein
MTERPARTSKPYTAEELLGPLTPIEKVNAPPELYAVGDLSLLSTGVRVSIVGSRKASHEGLSRAHRLAKDLASAGVYVVSGLAEGIDTAAHDGAIAVGGRTIAVMGTPLDQTFPKKNEALADKIAAEHLLISQFPPGMVTQRFHFPMRNRTMALISSATVIVEAGESSGSLSQGWEALRLGHLLFIMKSVVESKLKWPQQMLEYGARVLGSSDEVVDEIPSPALHGHDSVLAF